MRKVENILGIFRSKNIFQAEKYISVVTNKWHQSALARFRTRTLGLYASKKWLSEDTEINTICRLCSQDTEDETHFIFYCI